MFYFVCAPGSKNAFRMVHLCESPWRCLLDSTHGAFGTPARARDRDAMPELWAALCLGPALPSGTYVVSAPEAMSSFIMATSPCALASRKGVLPLWVMAFMSAQFSSKSFINSFLSYFLSLASQAKCASRHPGGLAPVVVVLNTHQCPRDA